MFFWNASFCDGGELAAGCCIYTTEIKLFLWEEEEEEGEPAVDFATIYGTQVLFWPGCWLLCGIRNIIFVPTTISALVFFSKISDLAEKWS